MSVHENQKIAGDSIIRAFEQEDKSNVLLLAQMQMGKSGTYWYVVYNMLYKAQVDNVLIISGNREVELHQQVCDDKALYKKWFFQQDSIRNAYSNEELKTMKRKFSDKISIIWGTSLSKTDTDVKNNTLIVWDEAHYAQSSENSPDKFFKNNQLDSLVDGTCDKSIIEQRNIKLLSVSATPFSCLAINSLQEESSIFKCIKLIPSENYYGIEYYLKSNRIFPSFMIDFDHYNELKAIISKYNVPENPKYLIIRCNESKESYKIVFEICQILNIKYEIYDSKHKNFSVELLKQKPVVPTVVVITGMLRMGKVLPKNNISMVMESSTKKKSARKTDTSLQGLLGRVCGYTNDPDGFQIDIYVDRLMISEIKQYIDTYNSEEGPIISKAMNIRTKKPQKRTKRNYTIQPIPLKPEFITKKENLSKLPILKWLSENIHELKMLSELQITTLKNALSDKSKFKFKNLLNDNNKSLFKMIFNESNESYLTLESDIIYITKYQTNAFLIIRNPLNEIPPIKEEICANDYGLYILDKCIFKPKFIN